MKELNRTLSLAHLVFYGVGAMVGAGIYSVIGAAAGEAGYYLWLSFALAGFAAFLTVLSYAELASALTKSGAEYQFLKRAFPSAPLFSFMAGYLIALNAAATSAAVSLAFAGYLRSFIEVPTILTAFILLVLCTAVNISGIKQSTWASIAMICVELAGLLLIVGAGFYAGQTENLMKGELSIESAPGVLSAAALIFFIYIGFEDVANLSEETVNPEKATPRALIISVVITTVLYILVAISVTMLGRPEALAQSESPLTLAAGGVAPWMGSSLAVAALFATASTALISLVSISRMLFGMAREGDMPEFLARTHSVWRTPWAAALVLFGAASLLLPLGKVEIVASISSFGVLTVFIGVHVALIALRYREPELQRAFTVPFSLGKLPLPPLLGILAAAILLTQFEVLVYAVGGAAIAFGVIIHLFLSRARS